MFESVARRWQRFWRSASALALAMDSEPFADIHSRVRRLEAAVFDAPAQSDRASAVPPVRPTESPLAGFEAGRHTPNSRPL
jgi:hypothetical protein